MPILQKGLEWAYILLCFTLVWYGIVLLSELWRWFMTRRGGSDLVRTSTKLMLAFLLAWGVIRIGMLTSTT